MTTIVLKAQLGEDIRRLPVDSELQFGDVAAKIRAVFSVKADDALLLRYVDEDGDLITVGSTEELHEAVAVAQSAGKTMLKILVSVNSNNNNQKNQGSHSESEAGARAAPSQQQAKQEKAAPATQDPLAQMIGSVMASFGPQIKLALQNPELLAAAQNFGLKIDPNNVNADDVAEQVRRNPLLAELLAGKACGGGGAAPFPFAQFFGAASAGCGGGGASCGAANDDNSDEQEEESCSASQMNACQRAWLERQRMFRECREQQQAQQQQQQQPEAPSERQVEFLGHETIGEGHVMAAGTPFIKIWRVRNAGSTPWPAGCRIQFAGGDRVGDYRALIGAGEPLLPNAETRVVLDCRAPLAADGAVSQKRGIWRVVDRDGAELHGDDLVVDIVVADAL